MSNRGFRAHLFAGWLILLGLGPLAAAAPAAAGLVPQANTTPETMSATLRMAITRSRARDAGLEYRIHADGRGVNPRHGLELAFTSRGALIEDHGGRFALHLERFGRGGGEPVRQASPHIDGAWVEYVRGAGVREWFVNLPQGVEQGWTIAERPRGTGPLVLELHTGRPPDRADDAQLAWSGLVYHQLVALDAEGQVLPARWMQESSRLRIEVDDSTAVYPVVVDPWLQQAKLTTSDEDAGGTFGYEVALSGDTAFVGAWSATVDGVPSQGAVYVFTRNGGNWSEHARLTASDGASDDLFFGQRVALSVDTAVVGAQGADVGGNEDQGAAYVFTRSDGIWSEQAKLTASDGGSQDNFSRGIALAGDTVLVGSPAARDEDGNRWKGAAYVFTRSGEIWSEEAKLTASDGVPGDEFGTAVALSGDTALVATPQGLGQLGKAYVFTRSDSAWSQQATLLASDGAPADRIGQSVALSGDTALVGGPRVDVSHNNDGAVYVFVRNGEVWSEQAKLTASDGEVSGQFGRSVALLGETALVGANGAKAAYVFIRSDGAWSEQAKLTASEVLPPPAFGLSVALSGDTALVGSADNPFAPSGLSGGAYVFVDILPNLAVVQGTVQGLGACRANPSPLVGATVLVTGAADTYSLNTDGNGFYQLPLDPAEGPVDISVSAPGHASQTAENIELAAGEVVTQSFDLVFEAACATADPVNLSAELDPDQSVTETVTLGNLDGGATLMWSVHDPTIAQPRAAGEPASPFGSSNVRRNDAASAAVSGGDISSTAMDLASVLGDTLPGVRPIQRAGAAVDCENEPGVVIHDDGTIENGYSGNPDTVAQVAFVDRFTPSAYPASFSSVCVALISGGPSELDLEIVVFDDDGPNGSPGTELWALAASAEDIPEPTPPLPPGFEPVWFSYEIASFSIESGSVYVGLRWAPSEPDVFVAADESTDNPVGFAGGYRWNNATDAWAPVESGFPDYRSLFVRAIENDFDCDDPSNVPWLSVAPISGELPVGSTEEVQVGFDSTGLASGTYRAAICIESNDPIKPLLAVPVVLFVSIPEAAVIEGTVEGLGYCGADPGPVVDAEIVIESQAQTYTVLPDAGGFYQLPLDAAEGPVDITASAPGHISQTVTDVSLAPNETVVQDFGLALDQPCVALDPTSFSIELDPEQKITETLTIGNSGGAPLDWEVIADGDTSGRILWPTGRVTTPRTRRPAVVVEGLTRAATAQGAKTAASYSFTPPAGQATLTMTHSESLDIHAPNTAACSSDQGQTTAANQFLRTFTLPDFGITVDFEVTEVTFGIETLRDVASAPIMVNLYTLEGEFTYDNLTLIGSTTEELPAQTLSLVTVPVTGMAPASSTLVVEIAAPDLSGVGVFIPGSNDLGETAPSYIAAGACGLLEPTRYADIDFPDVHLVMTVTGTVGCSLPTWVAIEPLSGTVPAGESDMVDVTFDAGNLQSGDYEANLCIGNNDLEHPLAAVPLVLTVTAVPAPELMFEPMSLDFGDVEVGSTGGPLTGTLHNSGSLEAADLTFDPPEGAFEADTSGCDTTLPVGESCEIAVTFTPTEAGPAVASLEVTSTGEASASLPLSGSGIGEPGFTPMALEVDPVETVSDGNGVFEPNEVVDVMPTWRNDGDVATSFTGTASDFTGPEGADYSLADGDADYGLVEPAATASCQDTGVCYRLGINDPAVRPATHWEATFAETLDDAEATDKTWELHIGDSFTDVLREGMFYGSIETLLHHGVTGGCTATEYCPAGTNSRAQMAVFLLKAAQGSDYVPPACEAGDERFDDVPAGNTFCPWIEELAARDVTSGCGGGNYCPGDSVTRAQMAVFLLKAAEGEGYTPPECTSVFTDVPCPSTFANWIEELASRSVTSGCSATTYCPGDTVTRQQMAVFLGKAFGLVLYGP